MRTRTEFLLSDSPQTEHFGDEKPSWWKKLSGVETWHRNTIKLQNKPVKIAWTDRAQKALLRRATPLCVEMQMYFGCNIVKHVNFYDVAPAHKPVAKMNDKLFVFFNPVIKKSCSVENAYARKVPYTDFAIVDEPRFVPRELFIDFRDNQWQGHYKI